MKTIQATTPAAQKITLYYVSVTDQFSKANGHAVEDCETIIKAEADAWFKQWKGEYSKEDGYKVKMVESEIDATPAALALLDAQTKRETAQAARKAAKAARGQ